jgi:hypothetical protein
MPDLQISFSMNTDAIPTRIEADDAIKQLIARYRQLPRHIARKHLASSIRKVLKKGVPLLRANTPPVGVRRGRRRAGEKQRSTGELRRAVTVRTGQTGKNNDFDMFVWGVLGYKAGMQSRKAIWLEYGTSRGISPVGMLAKTMQQFGPISTSELAGAMAVGLEKAANEIAAGKNPGRTS